MKNKKVLLSTLPLEGEFVNWTTPKYFTPAKVNKYLPLGILSLATNLPEKYDIKVLDPSSQGWSIDETIEKIEKENPDILGLSAVTRRVYSLNKILEKTSASYKAVGGPHTTYYAEQILNKGADAVFIGPLAETEFKEAVENLPKGIIECKTKINEIKFPRRDFLNVEDYFPKEFTLFKSEKRLPLFSSSGCPNKCNFCNVQTKRVQYKSALSIVDEMQYLYSIESRSVHILDDNFNINPKHVQGILDEMKKREFSMEWSGRGQTKMRLDLIKKLAEQGFKRMHVGIEALDDNILKSFRKNENLNDINVFCSEMNKNNIDILGYFIIGSPLETDEYRKNLAERINNLGIKHPFLNMLFPEPNTEYYHTLIKEGFYTKDYWKEYMENPTPYFEIPYPYGETKKQEVIDYMNSLIEKFNKKK
ncbi:MAG: radical SAM protein [Nanoarchaeota archaeon]